MQSSYNVIKKHRVNSDTIYRVEPQPVKMEIDIEKNKEEEAPAEVKSNDEYEKMSREVLNSAMLEADKIRKAAYEDGFKNGYDDGSEKGFDAGYKDGFNNGFKDGTSKGYSETGEIRQKADDVLKEAYRASREYIEGQRNEIIELSICIAGKITEYQADTSDSVIFNIINNAISNSISKEQIIIKVNPMDYALVDSKRDEIMRMAGAEKIISIVRDDEIKRGGCRLDTGISSVDAAIDTQLEKIKEALMG